MVIEALELDLRQIAESGHCFRWQELTPGSTGSFRGSVPGGWTAHGQMCTGSIVLPMSGF